MNRTRLRLLAVSVTTMIVTLTPQPTQGSLTFNYSYTFGSGLVVSGQLDGDQNGDYVENISNISVFFNGTKMLTPDHQPLATAFAARFDKTWQTFVSGPVVSFNALQNNFLFINAPLNSTPSSWFVFSGEYNDYDFASGYPGSLLGSTFNTEEFIVPGNWSLTAAAVPEPTTYIAGALLALPFGLHSIRFLRARKQRV